MTRIEIQNTSLVATQSTKGTRRQWLDMLRGLFIVLMAIDHASYFISKVHPSEFWGIPLPQYESVLPFLTRFVTHFCAPGFFFIMGISMMLFADARYRVGWSTAKVFGHCALRGAILIALQVFLEDPAWMIGSIGNSVQMINPPGGGKQVWFHFGVLYALGASMIVCCLLLRVRTAIALLLSIGAVGVTAAFIPVLEVDTLYSPLLRLLIIPGQTNSMQVFYPLFPWVGLAGAGVAFGKVLLRDKARAYNLSFVIGTALVLVFVFLRAFGFGSFHNPIDSNWMSFLNVTKYPPSLTFVMITMGVVLLLVHLFAKIKASIEHRGHLLTVFGKAALFFYIAHLYLYALIGLVFPEGASIAVMYAFWIASLLLLLPLCKRYGDFKRDTAPDSVWRFF